MTLQDTAAKNSAGFYTWLIDIQHPFWSDGGDACGVRHLAGPKTFSLPFSNDDEPSLFLNLPFVVAAPTHQAVFPFLGTPTKCWSDPWRKTTTSKASAFGEPGVFFFQDTRWGHLRQSFGSFLH